MLEADGGMAEELGAHGLGRVGRRLFEEVHRRVMVCRTEAWVV